MSKSLHFLTTLFCRTAIFLAGDDARSQLVTAVGFGTLLGLTPLWNVPNLFLFLLACLLRLNLLVFLASFSLFKWISAWLIPVFDEVGYRILVQLSFLQPTWAFFSTGKFFPYLRFNNSLVLGSIACSFFILIPTLGMALSLAEVYHRYLRASWQSSRPLHWIHMKAHP